MVEQTTATGEIPDEMVLADTDNNVRQLVFMVLHPVKGAIAVECGTGTREEGRFAVRHLPHRPGQSAERVINKPPFGEETFWTGDDRSESLRQAAEVYAEAAEE